jgi:hypothetical protein
MVGLGSLIAARSRPFAWIGDRGMTTFSPAAPRKNPYKQVSYWYSYAHFWTLRVIQSAMSHTADRRTYRERPPF